MAWNEQDASGFYFVCFRIGDTRFKRSLKTRDPKEADNLTARVEDNLRDVKRGRLIIPDDADPVQFLLSDGRIATPLSISVPTTLKELFDRYFNSIPPGTLEDSTVDGMKTHRKHLEKFLQHTLSIRTLSRDHLEGFIAWRSLGKIGGATIKKEVVTLRTVWNWALQRKVVEVPFPGKRLKYPKSAEKPPFLPFANVEERTKGLVAESAAEFWESVYLTAEDIEALLQHVSGRPFLRPMFCFAAYTGARRSEMLRARISDVDLKAGWVTLRERKRSHDQKTTRRVPICAALKTVLSEWLAVHPGGDALFCHGSEVARSKKRSKTTGHESKNRPTTLVARLASVKTRQSPAITPLTKDEAHNHFKKALANSGRN
jgi:integrase